MRYYNICDYYKVHMIKGFAFQVNIYIFITDIKLNTSRKCVKVIKCIAEDRLKMVYATNEIARY